MKRVIAILCLVTCLFSLSACSSQSEPLSEYDEITLTSETRDLFNKLKDSSDDELEQLKEESKSEYIVEAVESWMQIKDDLGAFIQVGKEFEIKESSNKVTVTLPVEFENSDENFIMVFKMVSGSVEATSAVFGTNTSIGEKMGKAALNTLIGMGTVFIVLIFIAFLISLFKYVPQLFDKKKNDIIMSRESVDLFKEEEDLFAEPQVIVNEPMEDTELTAVIMAAIAASEQTSTDGFVVRSIRKSSKSKWQKA